jgi:hypothetical protein
MMEIKLIGTALLVILAGTLTAKVLGDEAIDQVKMIIGASILLSGVVIFGSVLRIIWK